MLNIKTLSILAIAGTAVAAPRGWGDWSANYFGGNGNKDASNDNNNDNGSKNQVVDVVTAYTTVTRNRGNWGGNAPSATAAPEVVHTYAPSPAAPPAAPSKQAQPSSAPVASGDGSWQGTVGEWRSKMGLSALSEDSKLVANALKTAQDGNGKMVHQLNPGSFAQVLAPGSAGDFEKVFVGGWLCEMPNTPGLNGICGQMSKGWAYDGQTGHAEILTSSKYSKIGCANAGGIWSCDLA